MDLGTGALLTVGLGLGLGGLCKGATGMGLPMVALPFMATFLGLPHSIAILTLPVLVTNGWQVWQHRDRRDGCCFLFSLVSLALVGLVVGTLFLKTAPSAGLKLLFGLILASYVVLRIARPAIDHGGRVGRLAPAVGLLSGLLQGATGIAAPVLATWLHALRLDRDRYVFAISTVYLLFGLFQLPVLMMAGLVNRGVIIESAFALVPVMASMPLGSVIGRRLGQATFEAIVLVVIAAMALRFVWEGLAGTAA